MLFALVTAHAQSKTVLFDLSLIDFVRKGGALLFFVDDAHRVDIEKYGANDVVSPFGIEFGRRGIFTCLLRQVREWGKLYAAADTMVGLLLGYPDGVRKVSNKMQTRWGGKDSEIYMSELIAWALE